MDVNKVAKSYSNYCNIDLVSKLTPLSKSIDDLLTRLEEFETILSIAIQETTQNNDILTSILTYKNELNDLCNKVDAVENLTVHIKSSLDKVEEDIEKAEAQFDCCEKNKVTNIFIPLFKRNASDKRKSAEYMELFKTENYFK